MVRIKHRYLLVDILFPEKTNPSDVAPTIVINKSCPQWFDTGSFMRLIRTNVSECFGDYGAGVLGDSLSIKYFSQATSTAIIRCPRAHYRLVWAALTFADYLSPYKGRRNDERADCVFRVVRISGTIKKAEEEAIRRARRQILAVTSADHAFLDSMFPPDDEEIIDNEEETDEPESG